MCSLSGTTRHTNVHSQHPLDKIKPFLQNAILFNVVQIEMAKQTNKQTKRANTQTNNQTDVLIETLYSDYIRFRNYKYTYFF